MQLDEYLKSKVRYHLGFNAGAQIPAGDRARLEEAMASFQMSCGMKRLSITSNVVTSHGKQVLLFQMTTLMQKVAVL